MIPIPKNLNLNRDHFWLDDPFQGSFVFGIITNSRLSCMRFRDWILIMYIFMMYIMCFIIFEEKAEIQDQHPLSLNRDWDHLQKYWANDWLIIYSGKTKSIFFFQDKKITIGWVPVESDDEIIPRRRKASSSSSSSSSEESSLNSSSQLDQSLFEQSLLDQSLGESTNEDSYISSNKRELMIWNIW